MRSFRDETGTEWIVWAVRPQRETERHLERRQHADRRTSAAPATIIERRRGGGAERRRQLAGRGIVVHHPEGWLTFQTGTARRRLSPIPDGWDEGSDADLARLLASAEAARPASRGLGVESHTDAAR
jgi:hypothetical protein